MIEVYQAIIRIFFIGVALGCAIGFVVSQVVSALRKK